MSFLIEWTLPIKTVSELNCSQHWTIKAKRHRLQKKMVWFWWKSHDPKIGLPVVATLTRLSSRTLDEGDNLPASMKYVRDALSELLRPGLAVGKADDDSRLIEWRYGQEKAKKQGVRIQIEPRIPEPIAY